MATSQVSENLINILFHGAAEKFQKRCSRSKQIFKTECVKQSNRHKFRVRQAENERDKAILKFKRAEKPLKEVVQVLSKNGFDILSASLIRSRFLILIQKGETNYLGMLAFAPRSNITLNIFACKHPQLMRWQTMIFSVQYRPKKEGGGEVIQRNTFIRGVIKSMEEETNEKA